MLWHQLTISKGCIWSLTKPRIVSVRGSGGGVVLVAPVPCADAHLVWQKSTAAALWKCRTEPYLLRVIKTRSRETDRIFPEHVGSALKMFDRIIHMTKAQEKGRKSCPPSLSSFKFVCFSSTCKFFHLSLSLSLSSTCRYWTRSPPTPQPRAVVIPELNSEKDCLMPQ